MTSSTRVQANRANAKKSTGPRTAAGKARSSQNARKHGLRAQPAVLPRENSAEFGLLIAGLEQQFQPATAVEWNLIHQLADAEWRLRRVPHIEAAVFAKKLHQTREYYDAYPDQLPDDARTVNLFLIGASAANASDVLLKLSRYESRLSHRYFTALQNLRKAPHAPQAHSPGNAPSPHDPSDPASSSHPTRPDRSHAANPPMDQPPIDASTGPNEPNQVSCFQQNAAANEPNRKRISRPKNPSLPARSPQIHSKAVPAEIAGSTSLQEA
jgi:hypothetical protein